MQITVHPSAQFNKRTNKSHNPFVLAGNRNVGAKGELAKQLVVDAFKKASSVPASAHAAAIIRRIQTMVNESSMLHIKWMLVMNLR
jgi:hypothetical protein